MGRLATGAHAGADLLDRVASSHELGSHTHTHRHLSELRTDERREELAGSRERLEAATGADIAGFRAPSFDLAEVVAAET